MENILRASSAVSFRVLDVSRNLKHPDRFFQSDELNFTVVFKQPNFPSEDNPFTDSAAKDARSHVNGTSTNGNAPQKAATGRPVSTAIYVPRVREEPEIGGYGIFMGQQNYAELMRTYCGIDVGDAHVYGRDLELLRVLAETPSLDPFLLKTSLQDNGLTVNENYLNVVEEEEAEVRQVIEEKVRPIVQEAYGEQGKVAADSRTQSFIESIWNPRSTDAGQFISAFRIEAEAIPEIFGAWKGVAYYQHQMDSRTGLVANVLTWLQGEQSHPIDALKLLPQERDSLMMFRKEVANLLRTTYRNARAILDECDQSYASLVDDGNPMEFRDFLRTAVDKYWVLGGCNTALVMVTDIWRRNSQDGKVDRYDSQTLRTMFAGMKAAMDCGAAGSGAIG